VADQRLTPTFTLDLARAIVTAVDAGVDGILHLTNAGDTSWHGFTKAILEMAGVAVPVEASTTTRPPGGADRPLNGVLVSSVARRHGLPHLRPWTTALGDYLERAGLLAAAPAAG
jgi:dTDP-4-dehydrorhamnose reductase